MTTRSLMTLVHLAIFSLPFTTFSAKAPSIAEQALMIIKTAEKYHYSPKAVNDTFSEAVFKAFFQTLDPYGLIFTDEIIKKLDSFKYSLDDQIKQQKTTFVQTVLSLYISQLRIVDSLIRESTQKDIDLTVIDTLWFGGDTIYGKQRDFKRKWDQWIKYMVLWTIQNSADSSDTIALPAKKETQKIFNDCLTRETCRIGQRMNPSGGIDEFAGSCYLKAISMAFDPHTEYLSLTEKKQWETYLSEESGSFGIVLDLNITGEIEIFEVVPGGPAWNSNKIGQGDVLLSIKTSGSAIDLRCATLSGVYGFMTSIGNKQAIFKIRKKNGKIINVSLKKQLLDVEENTIRSFILKEKKSIGYIYLPSFYTDFSYNNFSSKGSANDMAKELIKLRKDSIDGIILDLRGNGGGSMLEAFRMAGALIDNGALAITHSRGKDPEIIKDNARGSIYNGPLVILVNSSSASASELFAGVLQDNNRAVIAGSKTFGKSTIQNLLPVDAGKFDSLSHYKGDPPGYIRLTTGTFYRVTGESHQKTGITPDIEIPEFLENSQNREASLDGVLEFSSIKKKTYYYPAEPLPVNKLKSLSDTRLKGNSGFKYIKKMQSLVPKAKSRFPVPLAFHSFAQYNHRFDQFEDSVKVKKCSFTIFLPDSIKSRSTMTEIDKADNEIIADDIKGDIYVNEAFTIINDLILNCIKKEDK